MKKLTNKEILDLYSGATDEEFKNILRISIPSYLSLVNSEKEAAEFLGVTRTSITRASTRRTPTRCRLLSML